MVASCFDTMFFAPCWWVRAFEAAIAPKSPLLNPSDFSLRARMTPVMGHIELNALNVLIASLQMQLLDDTSRLRLDPEHHRKCVSVGSKTKVFSFERVLQELCGLRILLSNDYGGYQSVNIFTDEVWIKDKDRNKLLLEVELANLGAELLLGYGEPYSDLTRFYQGKPIVQSLLGSQSPLALWRSVWLDLQGVEQAVLLRLEQAMQWKFQMLGLDGTFGQSIEELFSGISLTPRYRSSSSTEDGLEKSSSTRSMEILSRVGKKLLDHGLLTEASSNHYLAMGREENDGAVVGWKVTRDRTLDLEYNEYQKLVSHFLWRKVYYKNFDSIVRVLAGHLYDSTLKQQIDMVWHELSKSIEEINTSGDKKIAPLCLINNNMPILIETLYIEWLIRKLPGHPIPLPESLNNSPLAESAVLKQQKFDINDFRKFKEILLGNSEYISDIQNVVGATLANPITFSDDRYKDLLFKKPDSKSSEEEKVISRIDDNSNSSSFSKVVSQKNNIKRLAFEELALMRKQDPARYMRLKKAYIDTLDQNSKKIISEVQERLQPHVFDEHLSSSLVKFMIENPSLWRK